MEVGDSASVNREICSILAGVMIKGRFFKVKEIVARFWGEGR